jgi:mono/diheme cytochrome c family protein
MTKATLIACASTLLLPLLLASASDIASAGPTSKPDPATGKALAERLCTNCHLVGSMRQEHANPDVPTFAEIANMPAQSPGAIEERIMLPKHPMPQIPLTKAELTDLAAYIMSMRSERPQ